MTAVIGRTLDDFHDAASKADFARYFGYFTPDGVFLGTDPGERWTLEEFQAYAKPHFDKGRGWTYVPKERHVVIDDDGGTAWFDEKLWNDSYRWCRGTGALVRGSDGEWRVSHYSLTMLIPNEVASEAVALGDGPPAAPADVGKVLEAAMQRLAPLVGEWECEGTMGPAQADGTRTPQRGTWSVGWILNGKHLEINFDVMVGERPVQYRGVFSYNAIRRRYETVWLGSGGYRFAETGEFSPDGRSLVLTSRQEQPGRENAVTVVSTFELREDGTVTVTDVTTDPKSGETEQTFFVTLTRKQP